MNETNRDASEEKVSRRNAETIKLKLEQQDQMLREQEIRINQLNSTMSTLYQRMDQLEQRMNIEKIRSMGTGPSERG